jgi:uncharacterized protein
MHSKERFEKYKKIIIEIITQELPLCTIYFFGSRARETNRPGADIDIAIDNKNEIDAVIFLKIQEKLEESIIPFMIDLVDLALTSDTFKKQVLKEGIVWKK